ncbi:MAG: Maf family protein [Eubacteriales bacterium]|nr:Maf family protein [Eubacteriales bacterium]
MEKIILASASPRRRELLTQAQIPFEVQVSEAEEIITKTDPGEVVEELSYIKASAVAEKFPGRWVLGADTVVALQGEILGKPADETDARRMLGELQGQTHQVYTGVTLMKDGEIHTFHEATQVKVSEMSEEEILHYIAGGEPMDKAGAYGIQGSFAVFIEGIEGDYNNVVGLPIAAVYRAIRRLQIAE